MERICKRCLTRQMADSKENFKNMWEYIDNLDITVKTKDSEYERRLALCLSCERLLSGMCLSCGCYVEMRAALKNNTCPEKKWGKQEA